MFDPIRPASALARACIVGVPLIVAGAILAAAGSGADPARFVLAESPGADAGMLARQHAAVIGSSAVFRLVAEDPAAAQQAPTWAREFTNKTGSIDVGAAARNLMDRTRVVADAVSGLISVEVTGPSPEEAAALAGMVRQRAMDRIDTLTRQAARARAEATHARITELDRRAAQLQEEIHKVIQSRQAGPLVAESVAHQLDAVNARMLELPGDAKAIVEQLARQREELSARLVDLESANAEIASIRANLESVCAQRAQLALTADTTHGQDGPIVIVTESIPGG